MHLWMYLIFWYIWMHFQQHSSTKVPIFCPYSSFMASRKRLIWKDISESVLSLQVKRSRGSGAVTVKALPANMLKWVWTASVRGQKSHMVWGDLRCREGTAQRHLLVSNLTWLWLLSWMIQANWKWDLVLLMRHMGHKRGSTRKETRLRYFDHLCTRTPLRTLKEIIKLGLYCR